MTANGTFDTVDDRPALRFERRLRHPIDRVWRALTDTDDLRQWFPDDAGTREVTVSEPPHRLFCRWHTHELRFELEPAGDAGTLLRLTALLSEREAAARDAAGWHVCLDRLEQALDSGDATAPGPEVTGEWSELYDAYVAAGMPEGAPIPGRD